MRPVAGAAGSPGPGGGMPPDPRTDLVGLTPPRLQEVLREAGTAESELRMRASQVWSWLYRRGAADFSGMTDIARSYRAFLDERFQITRPKLAQRQLSEDGTRKYLLEFGDGSRAETVFIPGEGRGTLCVSSQVGCTLNCSFCHTGTQKLVRNLTAGEIVAQLLVCRDDLGLWPVPGEREPAERMLSNIVLMGMGEPLYNFDNVRDACAVFSDPAGIKLSRRRITLSTAGVAPMIPRAGEEIGTLLAISLHATTDVLRDQLVPINRKWNIETLLAACRNYPRIGNARRVTFEYVMLKEINDSNADARRLVERIRGIPAKINLIPFNPWPGAPYICSEPDRIEAFAAIVNRAGYASPVRTPRGQDILAACGQLRSESERVRRPRPSPQVAPDGSPCAA